MSALVTLGLGRDFGRGPGLVRAVSEISLDVARGELFGLVGPDGAGKTTLLRMMAGLLPPSRGQVRVEGLDPFGRGGEEVREILGLVPQEHSLYGDLTIAENLSFFADLYGISGEERRTRVARLLAITRLEPFVDRPAAKLSGGMYKKLAVACALLHQPDVLLLDEPTNGVDPPSRRELWELLYEFVEGGMTLVVTTPYMDEASRCHRVALVDRGEVIAEGAPERLVAALDVLVLELALGDAPGARERASAILEASPLVLASAPLGANLRVVVEPRDREALGEALRGLGALQPVAPSFEDLFLTAIARRDASVAQGARGSAA